MFFEGGEARLGTSLQDSTVNTAPACSPRGFSAARPGPRACPYARVDFPLYIYLYIYIFWALPRLREVNWWCGCDARAARRVCGEIGWRHCAVLRHHQHCQSQGCQIGPGFPPNLATPAAGLPGCKVPYAWMHVNASMFVALTRLDSSVKATFLIYLP